MSDLSATSLATPLARITPDKQAAHLQRLQQIAQTSQLRKQLDWKQLISLGIGCTIGAGIFVVTGKVGRDQTGPALFLSYIVSGVTCLFAALCYAEFAAMSPSAGSAYSYARSTMGELMGWIIGWDLILEYCVGAATVAQSWSSHLNELLHLMGGSIPTAIARPPWEFESSTGTVYTIGAGFDLCAVLITAAVTYVLYRGIKESANFNNIMVSIKLFVVFFVILVGALFCTFVEFCAVYAVWVCWYCILWAYGGGTDECKWRSIGRIGWSVPPIASLALASAKLSRRALTMGCLVLVALVCRCRYRVFCLHRVRRCELSS